MEIKEKKCFVTDDGEEFKTIEEAQLYVKKIKSMKDLKISLDREDYIDKEIENIIIAVEKLPDKFIMFANSCIQLHQIDL